MKKNLILISLIMSLSFVLEAKTHLDVSSRYIVTLKKKLDKQQALILFSAPSSSVKRLSDLSFLILRNENLETMKSVLSQNKIVKFVEQDKIITINEASSLSHLSPPTPNDPLFHKLMNLNNTKHPGLDISAPEAWEIQTGSKNVIVAIIDTGIDYTHPDLKENMWTNKREIPGNQIDDDENGFVDDVYGWNFTDNTSDPRDDNNHGTHCAGIIGAQGNNNLGLVGVNWNVSLMALKTFNSNGGGFTSDAVSAVSYAVKMGAHIISNSWGGLSYSKALETVIQEAEKKNILFVAAAGNESYSNDRIPTFPANYNVENVISVGAMTEEGKTALFSNFGKKTVHIFAPGGDYTWSTIRDEKYFSYKGTSMAAPHVAAVAALLLAENPSLTYQELKNRIIWSADSSSHALESIAGGFLNAHRALTNDQNPIDPNDSRFWINSASLNISIPKDFKNNIPINFYIPKPSFAKRIAVRFKSFNIGNQDTVKVFALTDENDKVGTLIETFEGGEFVKPVLSEGTKNFGLRVEFFPVSFPDEYTKLHIDRLIYSKN